MTNVPAEKQTEKCPMCGGDARRQPPRLLPLVPCPRCSAMPELERLTESGGLAFVASILPDLQVNSLEEALREIVSSLVRKLALTERAGQYVLDALAEHELLTSAELGCGIAIAYARYAGTDCLVGGFARSEAGLDFGNGTVRKVNLIFLVISPAARPAEHLRGLQAIARYLKAFDKTVSTKEPPNDVYA